MSNLGPSGLSHVYQCMLCESQTGTMLPIISGRSCCTPRAFKKKKKAGGAKRGGGGNITAKPSFPTVVTWKLARLISYRCLHGTVCVSWLPAKLVRPPGWASSGGFCMCATYTMDWGGVCIIIYCDCDLEHIRPSKHRGFLHNHRACGIVY